MNRPLRGQRRDRGEGRTAGKERHRSGFRVAGRMTRWSDFGIAFINWSEHQSAFGLLLLHLTRAALRAFFFLA